MPVLEVRGLSIAFGGLRALTDVTLAAAESEILGLIGPNGAGKTTVFNVLTGLYAPSAGDVLFRGQSLLNLAPHEICRRGIARTFQNTEIFRGLSAVDNVLVGLHARLRSGPLAAAFALPAARREERAAHIEAEALLGRVGLSSVATVDAGSLPLGMQKRLELARALAARPALLLLDEPAGGLNPTETQELMELISSVRRDERLTIVVVEHDMEVIMGLSDRVVVLDGGRKIAEGPPDAVVADPSVVAAYLGVEERQ